MPFTLVKDDIKQLHCNRIQDRADTLKHTKKSQHIRRVLEKQNNKTSVKCDFEIYKNSIGYAIKARY